MSSTCAATSCSKSASRLSCEHCGLVRYCSEKCRESDRLFHCYTFCSPQSRNNHNNTASIGIDLSTFRDSDPYPNINVENAPKESLPKGRIADLVRWANKHNLNIDDYRDTIFNKSTFIEEPFKMFVNAMHQLLTRADKMNLPYHLRLRAQFWYGVKNASLPPNSSLFPLKPLGRSWTEVMAMMERESTSDSFWSDKDLDALALYEEYKAKNTEPQFNYNDVNEAQDPDALDIDQPAQLPPSARMLEAQDRYDRGKEIAVTLFNKWKKIMSMRVGIQDIKDLLNSVPTFSKEAFSEMKHAIGYTVFYGLVRNKEFRFYWDDLVDYNLDYNILLKKMPAELGDPDTLYSKSVYTELRNIHQQQAAFNLERPRRMWTLFYTMLAEWDSDMHETGILFNVYGPENKSASELWQSRLMEMCIIENNTSLLESLINATKNDSMRLKAYMFALFYGSPIAKSFTGVFALEKMNENFEQISQTFLYEQKTWRYGTTTPSLSMFIFYYAILFDRIEWIEEIKTSLENLGEATGTLEHLLALFFQCEHSRPTITGKTGYTQLKLLKEHCNLDQFAQYYLSVQHQIWAVITESAGPFAWLLSQLPKENMGLYPFTALLDSFIEHWLNYTGDLQLTINILNEIVAQVSAVKLRFDLDKWITTTAKDFAIIPQPLDLTNNEQFEDEKTSYQENVPEYGDASVPYQSMFEVAVLHGIGMAIQASQETDEKYMELVRILFELALSRDDYFLPPQGLDDNANVPAKQWRNSMHPLPGLARYYSGIKFGVKGLFDRYLTQSKQYYIETTLEKRLYYKEEQH